MYHYLIRFYRCHFTLHLSECPEKAVKCFVKGCHTVVRRKEFKQHLEAAASSHSLFQQGEIQRLRRIMHFKVGDSYIEARHRKQKL